MQQKPAGRIRRRERSRDSLTGVLTKSAAEAQIASKMREKRGGALFLCDVDDIKRINERYGYLAGDECLKQTAQILSYMIHPNDILTVRISCRRRNTPGVSITALAQAGKRETGKCRLP